MLIAEARPPEPRSVLLIEDDDAAQYIYGTILERCGFRVRVSARGAGAVDLALELHPDLVILDIVLPDMSGFEVLRQIRAEPQTRGLKVLVSTVLALQADRDRGMALGCDAYLAKPVELPRFVEQVCDLLDFTPPRIWNSLPKRVTPG